MRTSGSQHGPRGACGVCSVRRPDLGRGDVVSGLKRMRREKQPVKCSASGDLERIFCFRVSTDVNMGNVPRPTLVVPTFMVIFAVLTTGKRFKLIKSILKHKRDRSSTF